MGLFDAIWDIGVGVLQQELGGHQIAALAQVVGNDTRQMASHLAQALPGLTDHLTPGGHLPSSGSVSRAREALIHR